MHNNTANEAAENKEIELNVKEENANQENEQNEDSSPDSDSESGEKPNRFKKGQILTFVRVRFPGNAKSFPFLVGKRNFSYGQKVVAMSDRGMTVGYINSFAYEKEFEESMMPIKSIAKVAAPEDIQEQMDNISKERKAEELCIRLIEKYNLNMNLTHVEFIQFGKKAVFYFTAPERVDFRDLVKELVSDLKMRIELRQISVRDRAAAIGAVGVCGLQTCCSSFLKGYGNVSIKMAKNQNLALIPNKINGVCGQIKCCIKYEDKVYSDKRSKLPSEGNFIQVKNGDRGKVTKLHILIEQFEMLTDSGLRRRYALNQYDQNITLPESWKFPDRFQHIIDETSNIIGFIKDDPLEEESYYWHQPHQDNEDSTQDDESSSDSEENETATEIQEDKTKAVDAQGQTSEDKDAKSQGAKRSRNRNRNNRNRNRNRPSSSSSNAKTENSNRPSAETDKGPKNEKGQPRRPNRNRNRNRRKPGGNQGSGNQGKGSGPAS